MHTFASGIILDDVMALLSINTTVSDDLVAVGVTALKVHWYSLSDRDP